MVLNFVILVFVTCNKNVGFLEISLCLKTVPCVIIWFFFWGANSNMCDMYLECYWKPWYLFADVNVVFAIAFCLFFDTSSVWFWFYWDI